CRPVGCSCQSLTALARFPAPYGISRRRPNADGYRTDNSDNSALPIEGRMDKNCPICFGIGWVCEDYLDRAWSESLAAVRAGPKLGRLSGFNATPQALFSA